MINDPRFLLRAERAKRLRLLQAGWRYRSPAIISGGFNPSMLFSGQLGDWWSTSSLTKLFQDINKTTPVAADNDPVGSWVGNVNALTVQQATAGARPLYKSSNATVLFDGVDDFLVTTANQAWTAYPVSIVALFDQSVTGTLGRGVVSVSATSADYTGINLVASAGSNAQDRAAANIATTTQSYPAGSGLAAAIATFASGDQKFRFNALTQATSAATNTHAAGRVLFGALRQDAGAPSLFSSVRLKEVIIINKVLTAGDQASLLSYWGL